MPPRKSRTSHGLTSRPKDPRLPVVELFAGVGGFRLGLEGVKDDGPWKVVLSNQWEPGAKDQFASRCYEQQFGSGGHLNSDVDDLVKSVKRTKGKVVPDHVLLVGGFPCQDYSVAKPLNQAHGIVGKKGVLWWSIFHLLEHLKSRRPQFLLLENVDRLLNSPVRQRGRDFAIILSCLARLGYAVEWRVIDASHYGFPQKRRRVFIFGQKLSGFEERFDDPIRRMLETGVLANAFHCILDGPDERQGSLFDEKVKCNFTVPKDPYQTTTGFSKDAKHSPFRNAGVMVDGRVWTRRVRAIYAGKCSTLGDIVRGTGPVDPRFFIDPGQLKKWRYLKGAKDEPRIHKGSGQPYRYNEGALPFPDPLDRAARTILTGEGGASPSRFRHVIEDPLTGLHRRLTPEELEALNGFPAGWTGGMSNVKRAFCMGNALVVGVVALIGHAIKREQDQMMATLIDKTYQPKRTRGTSVAIQ